jgi:hypothetical protein
MSLSLHMSACHIACLSPYRFVAKKKTQVGFKANTAGKGRDYDAWQHCESKWETSGHTLLQPGRRIMTQHPRLSREPSESIEDREHMRTWRASFWSMKPAQFGPIPDHSAVSLYLDAFYTWAQPDPVRNQEDLDRSIISNCCTIVDLCRYFS